MLLVLYKLHDLLMSQLFFADASVLMLRLVVFMLTRSPSVVPSMRGFCPLENFYGGQSPVDQVHLFGYTWSLFC